MENCPYLIHRKDLRVPTDLDEGSEPQCNEKDVWQFPVHYKNGDVCGGSNTLVYNSGLTSENPPKAPCDHCNQEFSMKR